MYCALAAEPIVPVAAGLILDALRVNDRERQQWLHMIDLESYGPGREFRVPDLLFRRIDRTEIAELEKRFEGI